MGSWPTWSCGTAAGPGPRTGSGRSRDSGQRNLPLHDFAQNQIWLDTVLLAADLLAWTATLGLTEHRRAEPKRLRLRLLHVAARVVRTGRRTLLKLPTDWPWASEIAAAHARLRALPGPS